MPAFFNTRSPVVRSPVDRKIPERPVRVRFDHEVIFWQKIIENIKCRKWRKKNSHNIKIFCEKIPCRSNLATKFKNQKIKKWLIEGRKNGFWVLTHEFKLISLSKTLLLMCNTLRPDRIRLRSILELWRAAAPKRLARSRWNFQRRCGTSRSTTLLL